MNHISHQIVLRRWTIISIPSNVLCVRFLINFMFNHICPGVSTKRAKLRNSIVNFEIELNELLRSLSVGLCSKLGKSEVYVFFTFISFHHYKWIRKIAILFVRPWKRASCVLQYGQALSLFIFIFSFLSSHSHSNFLISDFQNQCKSAT